MIAEIDKYIREYHDRDHIAEQMLGATHIINLHIDPESFRVWRTAEEKVKILADHGYPPFNDPEATSREIREKLLEDRLVDPSGLFTFEPDRVYLAFTSESVALPGTHQLRMRTWFTLDDCWILPLSTNLDAPVLKPFSQGPQTYEIMNYSPSPLVVPVNRLTCPTAVIPTRESSLRGKGTFAVQVGMKPRLGIV